jgi:hypothetical protein
MYDDDLFQEQVKQEAKNMLQKMMNETPADVLNLMETMRQKYLLVEKEKEILIIEKKELQVTASKWLKFLDSEGLLDMAEIADKLKLIYRDKNGVRKIMGSTKFAEALRIDNIILKRSNGYGVSSQAPMVIKENSKTIPKTTPVGIKTSVKFGVKALDYLENKYGKNDRLWYVDYEGRLNYE